MATWTDERVQKLEELWARGYSARQIAEELGEVTRNAVIGKAHRMGLSSRPSPIKNQKVKVSAPPKPEREDFTFLYAVREKNCQWPFGHPDADDFHFCKKPPILGKPYCEEHCSIAYRKQTMR